MPLPKLSADQPEPYRIDVEEGSGCSACGHGKRYNILHVATDTHISQSFEGGEDALVAAEDLCEQLNRAVKLEREQQAKLRKVWTRKEIEDVYDLGTIGHWDAIGCIVAMLNGEALSINDHRRTWEVTHVR